MDDSDPRNKPPCYREDALILVRALRDAGHVAYFAGGCVRDLLLQLEPKDYDVATDALPEKVRSLFRNTQAVGQAFGVILVRLGRSVIEVATFRSDGVYTDGRRPSEVRFTTAEVDAKRRDFTINGLFFDPIENHVLDFVGGKQDLERKTLRAIGEPDARFEEDHLRLMRAVRFAARFGLDIEPQTRAAIRHHAPQLARISPERVGEEARLMLTPLTRVNALEHLIDLGLLQVMLRFITEVPPAPNRPPAPLFRLVAPGKSIDFGLALAAITVEYRIDPTRPDWMALLARAQSHHSVQSCRKAMKISNDESNAMSDVLDLLPLIDSEPPTVAFLKRFLARSHSIDARRLLEAIYLFDPTVKRIGWLQEQFAVLEQMDCAPAPFVSGDDLTAAGFSPGPMYKRVLDRVYDAQLEQSVRSKEQAMEIALQLARQSNQ